MRANQHIRMQLERTFRRTLQELEAQRRGELWKRLSEESKVC